MFKTVRNKKIFQEILDQIKDLLLKKQLKVGQKIPSEIELSESFGISRSSLREALKVLSVLGIIESKTGEGTIIKQAEPEHLKNLMSLVAVSNGLDTLQLYEVRIILEIHAASLAAMRRTDQDLEAIKSNLIKMDNFVAVEQEADFLFHKSIVQASKNDMLIMLMGLISDLISEQIKILQISFAASYKTQKVQSQHWDIYRAIESGNPVEAQSAMLEHLSLGQIQLLEIQSDIFSGIKS
ncbi:FadR/GntR family transcriptional regulator [Neobacillus bataviensis]|nr:FadR/GntR family transcriptional regulator [Neobacillus bataviensis]